MALRIDGYVIVSADGMLADAQNVMPDELKFEGDKRFFNAALDGADLIVHGQNSHEQQPNSARRKRIVLTRKVEATETDPPGLPLRPLASVPASRQAPSPSSAAPACSTCLWTATTRSGCRWRQRCDCPAASPAFPAWDRARRSKFWRHMV
jgi:hypothetical protein